MRTLADAWGWYEATKQNLARMQRLGEKHWADPSLVEASIWHDDYFRMLEATDIVTETTVSLKPIDDLAIVVLFSVFESRVRDYLTELIEPQADRITDPILKELQANTSVRRATVSTLREVNITVGGILYSRPTVFVRPSTEQPRAWQIVASTPSMVRIDPDMDYGLATNKYQSTNEFLLQLADLAGELPLWFLEIKKTRCSVAAVSWALGQFTSLRELVLDSWYEYLTDADVSHIANLHCLESLSLDCADHLTAAGLAHLRGLSHLRELDLNYCSAVTDDALTHVGCFLQLNILKLAFTSITDQGLAHLRNLKKLRRLVLEGCKNVTRTGTARLQADLPECAIHETRRTDEVIDDNHLSA